MKRDARQVYSELLIYRAQGGDERSFAELFELWRDDVERFAASLAQDADGAEEIAQEAWISIAKGIGRLDDPSCFRAWGLSIVRRRSADWIRRRSRDRKRQRAVAEEAEVAEVEPSGLESVRLAEAIQGLDTQSRQLLSLYYETGLSIRELARRFQIAEGTVKSRLHGLREHLKRKLERK